jgi:hypothetical protein
MFRQQADLNLTNLLNPVIPSCFFAGQNLPGADLNSPWLVHRMKYIDVFHNPVTMTLDACFRRHDEDIPDSSVRRQESSVFC